MQISGAGEGGRMAGREPARPAKAVAHEPFRVSDRETARTMRSPPREVDASRPRVETKPSDTTTATRHADTRQAASEARSRQERAEDAAGTAARRQDAIDRDRAAKDKTTKDRATKDAVADDRVRKTVAATSSAATAAKLLAVAPDAAQTEAARAAAADDGTTEAAAGDDTETESEAAEATGATPMPIPSALVAPVATAPASGGGAATTTASTGSGAAVEAAPPADPKIAALLAEAAKAAKAGGGKDQLPSGGPVPLPDGLAAPDPSLSTPQAKGSEAAAPAAAETRPAVSVQAPLSAVPITIGMRALAGSNRFEIRLDPYELGRIDVSLDIARQHGTVKAHLVVERPETLALLQRDASSLQQALAQAGLDPGTTGLSFSLRDGGGQNPQRDQAGRPQGADRTASPAEEALTAAPLRNLGQRLGLDLRI